MRIGVDIDNVLSKFNERLLEEYLLHDKELRNTGIINPNAEYIRRGMFDWSKEEEEKFYSENIERMANTFEAIENASKYINKLRNEGNEIYIISGRANGEYTNPYDMTVNWLNKHNISYDKLILTNAYNAHEKTEVCLQYNIQFIIDDSTRVCIDAKKYGITPLLMDTPYNRKINDIKRVNSWEEIYNFIKKINNKKNDKVTLSGISKILIADHSIGKIISIFLDVFLAAYFYKISEQNILYLSLYNIIGWIVATIGAFLVADIIKRKDKVKLYRFGTIIKSLYILLIILLGEKIVDYVYLIGIMYGISTATTGFPLNMIESENISNKERSKYVGLVSVATEIISLVFPILLGAYISFKSYQIAAILIFVFSILKLILSFKIKNKNVQNYKVNLKEFYNILKKDRTLKKLYAIEFFKGINRYGIMSLVVSLLIIYNTNSELEVGGLTSLFSLFTIITMYLFSKYYKPIYKKKLLFFSLGILTISFILILNKIDMITIILYNIVYYIFMNIILKITEVDLFNYSNIELFKDKYNTEYFVFRELLLNLGRILGYTLLLLFVGITYNLLYLNIIFIIIIISIIVVIVLSNKLELNQRKEILNDIK